MLLGPLETDFDIITLSVSDTPRRTLCAVDVGAVPSTGNTKVCISTPIYRKPVLTQQFACSLRSMRVPICEVEELRVGTQSQTQEDYRYWTHGTPSQCSPQVQERVQVRSNRVLGNATVD